MHREGLRVVKTENAQLQRQLEMAEGAVIVPPGAYGRTQEP